MTDRVQGKLLMITRLAKAIAAFPSYFNVLLSMCLILQAKHFDLTKSLLARRVSLQLSMHGQDSIHAYGRELFCSTGPTTTTEIVIFQDRGRPQGNIDKKGYRVFSNIETDFFNFSNI